MSSPTATRDAMTKESDGLETVRRTTSTRIAPAEWDDFLQQTAGGHHVQSACWAEVKSASGWVPLRIAVLEDARIVAGIQLLLRKAMIWTIGYAGGGPVFATGEASIREILLKEMMSQARKHRISYLVLQPAGEDPTFTSMLGRCGFTPCAAELISRASILVDLSEPEEELLSKMRKRHRSYIRRGERAGVVIREVGEDKINEVHALMQVRAERRRYAVESIAALQTLWRVMGSRGHLRMTLAEYEGEVSAALVLLCWGDTVYWKRGGWNGRHSQLGLNELQHWESIVWAKRQGYRWVDLEGIDYESAREILHNVKASYDIKKSPNFFKIGFGGNVFFNPVAQEWYSNRFLRLVARQVFPRLSGTKLLASIFRWLRGVK